MADQELSGDIEESEDLFNFAELYAKPETAVVPTLVDAAEGNLSDAAAADSADSPGEPTPVFDESDCLFNFDELRVEADIEAVDAAQILADVPDPAKAELSEFELAQMGGAAPATAPPIEASEPPAATAPIGQPTLDPTPVAALPVTQPAVEPSRIPALKLSTRSPLLWILIASISLNLAVIGFTWRVSGTVSDEIERATLSIIEASQGTQVAQETEEPQQTEEASAGEPVSSDVQETESPIIIPDTEFEYSEHNFTFERAAKEIESGELSSARKRLYALLAVADRLTPDVRDRVEATAQYMLADVSMKIAMTSTEVAQ